MAKKSYANTHRKTIMIVHDYNCTIVRCQLHTFQPYWYNLDITNIPVSQRPFVLK